MMMRAVFLFVLLPAFALAQDNGRFVAKGLFSGKGTFAIGVPTAYGGTNMYASGNCEYYLQDDVSLRGGVWAFLGTTGTDDVLAQNSTLFTDLFYHIRTKNSVDPYVGIGPGISWTRLKLPEIALPGGAPASASPVASVAVGVNYYATKWAHLFVEARYVYGIHVSDVPAVSLSEFRVSFGFGFNFWTFKRKK